MTNPVSSGTVESADVMTAIKPEPPTRKEPNKCKRKASHCCAADAVNCALILSSSFTRKSLLNRLFARIERIVGSPCTEKFNKMFKMIGKSNQIYFQNYTCFCEMYIDRTIMQAWYDDERKDLLIKRIKYPIMLIVVEPTSLRYSTVFLYLSMNFDSVIGYSNK